MSTSPTPATASTRNRDNYGPEAPEKLVVGVVRGDMEVNEIQLMYQAEARDLRPPHPEEIEAAGAVPGYASPHNCV